MKQFNTTAICIPSKHYMVDISDKVNEIKKLVEAGKYFTINRARQYGKTTTLRALKLALDEKYVVLSLSFEGITKANFSTEQSFVKAFCRLFKKNPVLYQSIPDMIRDEFEDFLQRKEEKAEMDELFMSLSKWCSISEKPIVLLIDEVDSATNNQVFLDFLGLLRDGYISRESNEIPAFQSVVLAGVTDVKHLKSKIRDEADSKENSPWNIAAEFTVDMSLSEEGIRDMLDEYEADHKTEMNTEAVAKSIHDYTNGYPFLVSRICELIDTRLVPDIIKDLSSAWTEVGINEAVKIILSESNTLFDSIMGKLRDMPGLRRNLKQILFEGESIAYSPDNDEQKQLCMYGFIVNDHNTVMVANRIFEMRLYKFYLGESSFADEMRGDALDNKPEFIRNGELNIPLIMQRFIETQKYIRKIGDEAAEKKFIEEEGREKFLTYISPIINGVGTFSIEEETRDRKRMDVVIHYNGKRYIIELKIWHGQSRNADGERQIVDYLDHFGLKVGYMLSFCFNKNKEPGVNEVHIGDKTLYEGVV